MSAKLGRTEEINVRGGNKWEQRPRHEKRVGAENKAGRGVQEREVERWEKTTIVEWRWQRKGAQRVGEDSKMQLKGESWAVECRGEKKEQRGKEKKRTM